MAFSLQCMPQAMNTSPHVHGQLREWGARNCGHVPQIWRNTFWGYAPPKMANMSSQTLLCHRPMLPQTKCSLHRSRIGRKTQMGITQTTCSVTGLCFNFPFKRAEHIAEFLVLWISDAPPPPPETYPPTGAQIECACQGRLHEAELIVATFASERQIWNMRAFGAGGVGRIGYWAKVGSIVSR